MPIYEYECTRCGEVEEIFQKISDKPLSKCKKCSGKLHKLISHSSFHLKGTGWYATDYASKSSPGSSVSKKTDESKTANNETSSSKKNKSEATTNPSSWFPLIVALPSWFGLQRTAESQLRLMGPKWIGFRIEGAFKPPRRMIDLFTFAGKTPFWGSPWENAKKNQVRSLYKQKRVIIISTKIQRHISNPLKILNYSRFQFENCVERRWLAEPLSMQRA